MINGGESPGRLELIKKGHDHMRRPLKVLIEPARFFRIVTSVGMVMQALDLEDAVLFDLEFDTHTIATTKAPECPYLMLHLRLEWQLHGGNRGSDRKSPNWD